MQKKKRYTIHNSQLRRAYYQGFAQTGEGVLSMTEGKVHVLILNRFCSYEETARWGRFHCDIHTVEDCACKIHAFAKDAAKEEAEKINSFLQDAQVPLVEKLALFEQAEGIAVVNSSDILLYELEGEYLFICVEMIGEGSGIIENMELDSQGDNFMQTFPEIYQEEGAFFHRYMSIFSSIYNDISKNMAQIERYLDLDTAPEELLPYFAEWLGLELEGEFLDGKVLRGIIKAAYQLNRMKGTGEVLRELIRIMLGEEAAIVERNRLNGCISNEEAAIYQKLYGTDMQEVTILVNRPADEKLQAQILFLVKQFKPVRSRVKLVFYQDCDRLDSYCYLDLNATLTRMGTVRLDEKQSMNGMVVLE